MKDFISPMKKLYKIVTHNTMIEEYEVVVEDTPNAKELAESLVFDCWTAEDRYPMNVERTSQYFDDKKIENSFITAYECELDDENLVPTHHAGWFRHLTSEELIAEIKNEEEANGI